MPLQRRRLQHYTNGVGEILVIPSGKRRLPCIPDDTGFLKQGKHSVGVKPAYGEQVIVALAQKLPRLRPRVL